MPFDIFEWPASLLAKRQFCRAPKLPFCLRLSVEGSALLPFTSFRLSRQQVDDEPMLCFHFLYRRGGHKCACTCLLFSLETLQRAGRRTAAPALVHFFRDCFAPISSGLAMPEFFPSREPLKVVRTKRRTHRQVGYGAFERYRRKVPSAVKINRRSFNIKFDERSFAHALFYLCSEVNG